MATSRSVAKRKAVKPTAEMILARAAELRNHFRTQDAEIDEMRQCLELKMTTPLPAWLKRVGALPMKDPTLTEERDRVVAALISEPPKLTLTPADESRGLDQVKTTEIERWTMQAIAEAGSRVMGQELNEMMICGSVSDGAGWAKMVYDKHLWENVWNVSETETYRTRKGSDDEVGPEEIDELPLDQIETKKRSRKSRDYLDERERVKKGAGVPISIISVDAACVFPVWNGTELVEVLEITERPVLEVLSQYGIADDGQTGLYGQPMSLAESSQYTRTCRFLEHWNCHYVTYMLEYGGEQRELAQIRHNYGFVPYYVAFGRMSNWWRGRKKGDGIGQSRLGLIKYRQYIWDLVVNIAGQSAGTPIVHTMPDVGESLEGETNEPKEEETLIQLAGMLQARPGEDYRALVMPGVPDSIRDLLQILNAMIDRTGVPRINANVGGGLEGAGYAVAQILTEIRTALNAYVLHLQQAYTRMTRDFWKLLRDHLPDEKIYVLYTPENPRSNVDKAKWLYVIPEEDLTDSYGVRWEINPEPPTASIVKSRYWAELLQAQMAYPDQAREALGFNPSEVRRGLLAERLRNEGVLKDYELKVVMEKLRMGDLIRKAAQQMAQGGEFPGPQDPMAMGMGAPLGQVPGGMAPGAPMIPDPAMLSMVPGGAGAAPQMGGFGQGVPPQTAVAAVQSIGR